MDAAARHTHYAGGLGEPAVEAAALRRLSPAEVEAYLSAPVSDDEREQVRALVGWFRRRYPTGADWLAYLRGALQTLDSRVDLNGDGRDEVFVYLVGPVFCGSGGCNLLLFTRGQDGYALLDEFPISHTPVVVSPQSTGGWRDIYKPESGGGAAASHVR